MNKSKKSKRLRIKSLLDKNVKTFKNKLKTSKTNSRLLGLIQKKYLQLKSKKLSNFLYELKIKSSDIGIKIKNKAERSYRFIKPIYLKFSEVYLVKLNNKVLLPIRKKILFAFSKKNAAYEGLLQQDRFWINSVTWTIIGTTLFGIGWLSIAKTDEIIVVQGKIVPIGEVTDIKMPMGGIVKKIIVNEGDYVNEGDILLELDDEANQERSNTLTTSQNITSNQLELKKDEFDNFIVFNNDLLESYEMSLDIENDLLTRLKGLLQSGAISEAEILRQKLKIQDLKSRIIQTRSNLQTKKLVYQQEISNLRKSEAEIKGQFAENLVNMRYKSITSPVSGIVFDLQPKNVGYSAQMTESILKIVPTGDFEANLEIPSADIGFVKNGMDVDLSIDSFPASDFGVLTGKISRIGSDSLKPNPQENRPGFAYPATVELSNQFLKVKDKTKLDLKVGMTLTANIKLRKVSYIQLLLSTFKNKTDSIKEL